MFGFRPAACFEVMMFHPPSPRIWLDVTNILGDNWAEGGGSISRWVAFGFQNKKLWGLVLGVFCSSGHGSSGDIVPDLHFFVISHSVIVVGSMTAISWPLAIGCARWAHPSRVPWQHAEIKSHCQHPVEYWVSNLSRALRVKVLSELWSTRALQVSAATITPGALAGLRVGRESCEELGDLCLIFCQTALGGGPFLALLLRCHWSPCPKCGPCTLSFRRNFHGA